MKQWDMAPRRKREKTTGEHGEKLFEKEKKREQCFRKYGMVNVFS
jgi:hypothetical protein